RLAQRRSHETRPAPIEALDAAGVEAPAANLLKEEDLGKPANQEVLEARAGDGDRHAATRADRGPVPPEIEQRQGGMLEQLTQRPAVNAGPRVGGVGEQSIRRPAGLRP